MEKTTSTFYQTFWNMNWWWQNFSIQVNYFWKYLIQISFSGLTSRFKTSIWVICCQLLEAHQWQSWQSEQRELTAIWTENFPLGERYVPRFVSQSSHLRVSFNMFPPSKEPQLKQQMGMRYFQPGYACHLSDRILFDSKVFVQLYWETMQNYKSYHTF